MIISIIPKQRFNASLPMDDINSIATNEAKMLKRTIIHIARQRMCLQFLMAISNAVVPASNPERVTDSPYDGRKKGKNIITKIPKPKPLTLCMKLAAMVSINTNKYAMIAEPDIKKQLLLFLYPIVRPTKILVGKKFGKPCNLLHTQQFIFAHTNVTHYPCV